MICISTWLIWDAFANDLYWKRSNIWMVESMNIPQEIQSFNPDEFDFDDKEQVKTLFFKLFNVVETQAKTIEKLKQENQQLKDENQRLKGEKGKPSFKPNVPNYDVRPGFRKATKKWKKKGKKADIKIDRVEKVQIDCDVLPSDAVFKGYRSVIACCKTAILASKSNFLC